MRSRPKPGKNCAGAEHVRLVGLDAQAEEQHRVDVGVAAHQVERLGNRVPRLAPREIDRVLAAPAGGHHGVDPAAQLVGKRDHLEPGGGARVRGEHAPAACGGEHDHPAPARPGLRREGRCPFERLLDRRRAQHAELPADAVEHAIVAGQRPRVARSGALAFARGAALQQHERLRGSEAPERVEEGAPVADALGVCQRHRGVGVDGEVVQVVGDRGLRGVAAGDRLADADAGQDGVVEEGGEQVAALARHRDAARRRVGRDDLGTQSVGGRDQALTVGAGQQDAGLVRDSHQLGLERLAVAGRTRRSRRWPRRRRGCRARRRRAGRRRWRRAACRRPPGPRRPSGTSRDVAQRRAAEHLGAIAVHREDHAAVAEAQQVVEGGEAELSRDASRRRRRPRRAGGRAAGSARPPRGHRDGACTWPRTARTAGRARPARRPRPAARRARSSGFRSTLCTSARSIAEGAETDEDARQCVAVDRRLAAKRVRAAACVRSPSIMRRASAAPSGAAANTTSPIASVKMPPRPSTTQRPNCGSRTRPASSSRRPRTSSATSSSTAPSSGRASASSSAAAARTAGPSASPTRTRPRSVLWAMASPHSFRTTGKPISSAARAAAPGSAASTSRATGTP